MLRLAVANAAHVSDVQDVSDATVGIGSAAGAAGGQSRGEALAAAAVSKAEGGMRFGESQWSAACDCYEQAVQLLQVHGFDWAAQTAEDTEAAALRSACLANQSMCCGP